MHDTAWHLKLVLGSIHDRGAQNSIRLALSEVTEMALSSGAEPIEMQSWSRAFRSPIWGSHLMAN